MLTKAAICWIYISSYFLDYVVLLFIFIWKMIGDYTKYGVGIKKNFFEYCHISDYIIGGALLILILLSLTCVYFIKNLKMNMRIKVNPQDNIVWDMSGYIFGYVATILTIIFTDYWLVVSGAIFLVVGVFYIKAEKVYCSPLFIIPMGYKIFQCGNYVVVTDYTKEELRLEQEGQQNGVQARMLQGRGYLITKCNNKVSK